MVSRDLIIKTLTDNLQPLECVCAAWLGGSDSSGRTDEYSDVDFMVIVEDDSIEEVFNCAFTALKHLSPIAHEYRLPEPTWHGNSQCFYQLENALQYHMIDLCLLKKSSKSLFLEPERHGNAEVLFDKINIIKDQPFDRDAHTKLVEAKLKDIEVKFPLFQNLITKAIRRGHLPEAVYFYHQMSLRPLVDLLRIKYCPDRYDYGLRYLDRDLPNEWREKIAQLAFTSNADDLEEKHRQVVQHLNEVLVGLNTAVNAH